MIPFSRGKMRKRCDGMSEQIEKIRQKGVKQVLVTFGIVMLIMFVALLIPSRDRMPMLIIGGFGGLIAIVLVLGSAEKKYRLAYKETFLRSTIENEFEDVKVNFEEGFSEEEIAEGHLVHLYENFYSDDYISGRYKDIVFECSDIKVEDVIRNGKHTQTVTCFQGLYLKVNLKKRVHGWTVVREREFLGDGNPRPFWSEMPHLERVRVESEAFNQKFSIYTSDGQEAFYLLTPHFMEKLLELERRYDGKCMFGFLNGQLHVAIDSREDHFVIGLFDAVDKAKIAEHQAEIDMIKGIVELVAKECETTWNTF